MEQILMKIVDPGKSREKMINAELLRKHTKMLLKPFANVYPSSNVRWLYLIGSKTCEASGVAAGTYVDEAEEWMLMAGGSEADIQGRLKKCGAALEYLMIYDTGIKRLNINNFTGLKTIFLSYNEKLSELGGCASLGNLEELRITYSGIRSIAFPSPATKLRILDLGYNKNLQEVDGLDHLPGLEELNLKFTSMKRLELTRPLPRLREFVADCSSLEDASCLTLFPNVRRVRMQATPISTIPSLEGLNHLEILVLYDSTLSSLDGVAFPVSLTHLWLGRTKIVRLPDTISHLPKLFYLGLCRLQLEELPDWLPDLGLTIGREFDFGIDLKDTTVNGVDMSIFDQSQEVIRAWFEARRAPEKAKPLNELKVVFLGDGGAGKSHTIARLMLDGGQTKDFPNVSTPGIVIKDKEYKLGERNVQVHFWDFGGQDILHSMHRMFLTDRTLYVVMVNVRDGTQNERARYWLHNLRSFAGGAPVLLVLNQIDTNRNAKVNETDLSAMYPNLTEVVAMSALEDSPESVQENLIAVLKRQIGAFPTLESPFLPAWSRLKDRLHGMEDYYIRGDAFSKYCEECGVEDNGDIRLDLLRWFSDLGVSFHYGSSRKLKDFVILRPDWLTNAVYTIIFNKSDQLKNGLISHDAIHALLNPGEKDREKIRSAFPEMRYSEREVDFVLNVVRKFRLSYQVGDDLEFIPLLCQANSLPVAQEYESDPNTLEFRMEYEYLPNNVLHRLMVDLRRDLVVDQVWFSGALFRQKSNGLSAVVKTEGDVLRIFVRGEKPIHRPHTYLNTIRDALAAIHRDMGLAAPESEIVYKKDGKSERFSYDYLLDSLENGIPAVYSRTMRRAISILDILDQSDREVEREKQALLDAVAAACVRLQGNQQLWKTAEDNRNTYLRDLLLSKGYHVSDQTLIGVGAGGKRSGEVDLLIRNAQNLPWMACEAMNIESDSSSQLEYWDKHMNKLLVNYNPVGMQNLILISYVAADADKFTKLWSTYSEHMRWYDPPKVIRRAGTYQEIRQENYDCIRIACCTYDRGGMPTNVYHYFLRLGL